MELPFVPTNNGPRTKQSLQHTLFFSLSLGKCKGNVDKLKLLIHVCERLCHASIIRQEKYIFYPMDFL